MEVAPDPARASTARILARLGLALLVLGVVCRLWRYGLDFPIWGDEAYVCANLLDRDFLGLTKQLDCNQVAPVLFLWGEKVALLLFGPDGLALRLVPFLASLVALGLFAHLARLTVSPLAAFFAVGLLAVARWPVTMGSAVKPYSLDLLASVGLLTLAFHALRQPGQWRWLLALAVVVPVALLSSYPSVFVAGAVSIALLPAAWRGSWKVRGCFLAYNAALLATFLVGYLVVGREQLDPEANSVGSFMRAYWAHGFPPASPFAFLYWALDAHTGRMLAYPIGDAKFGSTAQFLVFLVGLAALLRWRSWHLLSLALVPFALNFVAAVLGRYPYAGCCRLTQHLAPAICLLMGVGLAVTLEWVVQQEAWRRRWIAVWGIAFALFGLGQIVADGWEPYRDRDTDRLARLSAGLLAEAGPEDVVALWQDKGEVEALFRYHLGRDARVRYGAVDWEQLRASSGVLWAVNVWAESEPGSGEEVPELPRPPVAPGWRVEEERVQVLQPLRSQHPLRRLAVFKVVPAQGGGVSRR